MCFYFGFVLYSKSISSCSAVGRPSPYLIQNIVPIRAYLSSIELTKERTGRI